MASSSSDFATIGASQVHLEKTRAEITMISEETLSRLYEAQPQAKAAMISWRTREDSCSKTVKQGPASSAEVIKRRK